MPGNRNKIISITLLFLTILVGQANIAHSSTRVLPNSSENPKSKTQSADDDTTPEERAVHANYMSPNELEVVAEINLLRSDPPAYARLRLEPLRVYYHGKLFFHPDRSPVPIQTDEGIAALEECISILEKTKPLSSLSPCEGLTMAAHEMTLDQGATKNIGHVGSSGSRMSERIERYGEWNGLIAENISYGFSKPKDIVAFLLIDDGVSDRGHRITLLDTDINRVGVSIGKHRRYDDMCVMEFADRYKTAKP
ncbi:MAG: CAP domain-containing protein [Chlorobaculum sp.]|jgi:uncharacterized protein YkwD|nr:CAP domain-containing protein [Chlorobaculum sp.]